MVIDQWVDDWDRCAALRGLRSNPFSQNIGGVCDDVASGKRRHVEWYGLGAQYDSFGTHCIEARFLPFSESLVAPPRNTVEIHFGCRRCSLFL